MRNRTHLNRLFSVGAPETEPSARRVAMEVTVIWNGTVQSVVEKLGDGNGDAAFTVGEDPACDFVVPVSDIGGRSVFSPAAMEGGVLRVNRIAGVGTRILRADGVPRAEAASTVPLSGDGERISTAQGDTAEIDIGPVLFRFRITEPLEKVKGRIAFDRRTGGFVAFSALLHAAVLFGLWLVPPNAAGLHMDNLDHMSPIMKVMLSAPEARLVEPPKPKPEAKSAVAESGGAAHEGGVGEMGDRRSERTQNRSSIKGPRDNPNPVMMRERLRENITEQGILAVMSSMKMPVSPFGSDNPVGFDPENALGALVGREPGVNLGLGGLGPKGTGRGGGGNAKGGIGVGRLGRIAWSEGKGRCTGAACPNWTGGKGDMNGRRSRGPVLKSGKVDVMGSLSKETIRRIVRRHLNEVRFCYEQGLQRRPDLGGRVSIKFTIADSGKVQAAFVASSTIGDAQVAACIAQTVNRMTFPAPQNGGIVIVSYPFNLTASM